MAFGSNTRLVVALVFLVAGFAAAMTAVALPDTEANRDASRVLSVVGWAVVAVSLGALVYTNAQKPAPPPPATPPPSPAVLPAGVYRVIPTEIKSM